MSRRETAKLSAAGGWAQLCIRGGLARTRAPDGKPACSLARLGSRLALEAPSRVLAPPRPGRYPPSRGPPATEAALRFWGTLWKLQQLRGGVRAWSMAGIGGGSPQPPGKLPGPVLLSERVGSGDSPSSPHGPRLGARVRGQRAINLIWALGKGPSWQAWAQGGAGGELSRTRSCRLP